MLLKVNVVSIVNKNKNKWRLAKSRFLIIPPRLSLRVCWGREKRVLEKRKKQVQEIEDVRRRGL